ncbi:hypothetical protein TKK_0005011 [Trichogramma kaykai]|uniref:Nucleoprotein TPR n=1 Tax=Trichogramma kaykai TaxID=54128 RepID=A0ABD2XJ94_9HYME
METFDPKNCKILKEFLTSDEIKVIDDQVCFKLENYLQDKCEELFTAKAVLETYRVNTERDVKKLEETNESCQENLKKCEEKLELAKRYTNDLHEQIENLSAEVLQSKATIKRLEGENSELRKQRDVVQEESNTLHSQLDRKEAELNRLNKELASLGAQLEKAITEKCNALAQSEEIRSKELSLEYREKRFHQEKTILVQQISGLEEELTKRTNELQNARSQSSAHLLLIQTRLSQCEENLKVCNETITNLQNNNSILNQRNEELNQKLEEQRNNELTMHASYQEEISSQKKLADIFKKISEEANEKAEEYGKAITELQVLLKQATEQYGILETKHHQTIMEHKNEMEHEMQKMNEIKQELLDSRNLIESLQKANLDQSIEELAPTAAVASKILKKGLSLTQIYTQYVDTTNALTSEKEENSKLKYQMEMILKELEEKAPLIKLQQRNYEEAMKNVNELTSRLDDLIAENDNLQVNAKEADRLVKHHAAENQRLKTEIKDLARQVCYLLQEVQNSRVPINNESLDRDCSMDLNLSVSSRIISKQLVTFKNIEELQENNKKLLSLVRTLSSRQEETEKTTNKLNVEEMREKISRYVQQLADMQEAQSRQAKMLEEIMRQRDLYKNMYKNQAGQLPSEKNIVEMKSQNTNQIEQENTSQLKNSKDLQDLQLKYNNLETKYTDIQKEFDLYKKEKVAHVQLLNDEIEKLRENCEKYSTRSCMLKAQLESITERFGLLQSSAASQKSQIKMLEEKCNCYIATISKHEQSLILLKDETLSAQNRLSKAEIQLENLKQEKQLLRDSENRLLKEREALHRERHTHDLLKADVESIKASLERVNAESNHRTEQRLDDTIRECSALRRRLQEEQDHFRDHTAHLERQLETSNQRLEEQKHITARIESELTKLRSVEEEYVKNIDQLNMKLKEMTKIATRMPQQDDEEMRKKLENMEAKYADCQTEIKSLLSQLEAARAQGQQYCNIAESSESHLRESIKKYEEEKRLLENELSNVKNELNSTKLNLEKLQNDNMENSTSSNLCYKNLKEKLASAERELKALGNLKSELEESKNNLKIAYANISELENKFTKEMSSHSDDVKLLSKIKVENQELLNKISLFSRQENLAKEALELEKSMWHDRQQQFSFEIRELQERLNDVLDQNNILHNTIQEFSEQTALMQTLQQSDMNSSFSSVSSRVSNPLMSEEPSNSTEQLLQVIKYLRREKDLAVIKFDVLKSENSRLKSQIELCTRKNQEMKELFDQEREKSEIDIVTASKHSELLRKIETLNAITDSNRILREERDSLLSKVTNSTNQLNSLLDEITPLREKSTELEATVDVLKQENTSLKAEALRWRQRANALTERSNKASPEDWRRLQTERDNLSKLLSQEKETVSKRSEELDKVKSEKKNLEDQITQLQTQLKTYEDKIALLTNENQKMKNEIEESLLNITGKNKEIDSLKLELTEKESSLTEIKMKEIQIRKIAKKYKTQYEDLMKSREDETKKNATNVQLTEERTTDSEQKSENISNLQQTNLELNAKVTDLNQQILSAKSESDDLKREIEQINNANIEKEERAKQVLKGARTKIMQLTEYKKLCEKEMLELKEKLDSSTTENESHASEYEAKLMALKSQMESRISRLEHERLDLQAEKEVLLQRAVLLQRQLSGQINSGIGTTDPPTANIKPMSARTETPLASIRPMSVVVQSRTAAVLPTTVGTSVHLITQQSQQLVHTTETSSPTSSHMDYQPASTSRQHTLQSHLGDSAESTQREETDTFETGTTLQNQLQQQQNQSQAVALVSPRIEAHQQTQSLTNEQQQTIPSSSTQSVSTSHTNIPHKRPRSFESTVTGVNLNETLDHSRSEPILSPKNKKSKQETMTSTIVASALDVEYQVPTSSQRDQDDDVEENCGMLDCDEGPENQTIQEEDFDNEDYGELEEEEELPFSVEVGEGNNEVEIIIDESANENVSRHLQSNTSGDVIHQSEAISSAGLAGDSSFVGRMTRSIGHMQRPQPQLLLQGFDDIGDDCIVPSTPTLFVPRRIDSFGETVSSPQVPHTRFTFGDSSTSTTSSLVQSQSSASFSNSRSMMNVCSSDLVQIVHDGIDDSRVDLSELDNENQAPNEPITQQSDSPNEDSILMLNQPSNVPSLSQAVVPEEDLRQCAEASSDSKTSNNLEESPCKQMEVKSSDEHEQPTEDKVFNPLPEEECSFSQPTVETATQQQSQTTPDDTSNNESREYNSEAEASSADITQAAPASELSSDNASMPMREVTTRRSARSSYRASRGTRPTPIVWDSQSPSRGQMTNRGISRGGTNDGTRSRSLRGRRMRAKHPYGY